eukprot:7489607-Ditylum_brightwellii.AAC.1
MLLRFGVASEELREEFAHLADWLANGLPPWAAYRAVMANRLAAMVKCPGTRPVGIGEILCRLIAKMVIRATGDKAKVACGNLQLCAGLEAGIEGAVHAVRMRREKRQAELQQEAAPATQEQEEARGRKQRMSKEEEEGGKEEVVMSQDLVLDESQELAEEEPSTLRLGDGPGGTTL